MKSSSFVAIFTKLIFKTFKKLYATENISVVCVLSSFKLCRINYFPLGNIAPSASTSIHFYLISSSDDRRHSLEMKKYNVTQINSARSRSNRAGGARK